MKELWSKIDFNPQTFVITEAEYDDTDDHDNIVGDRKILNAVVFPRSIEPTKLSPSESAKCSVVRINNFPQDISDEDVVHFINKETNEKISTSDVKSEKTNYSKNVYLGPGPSIEVLAKVIEILDYKSTSKTFFEGRRLYAQLHRPLTPIKKSKDEENGSELEVNENKIKEKVTNLNKVVETPKIPGRKAGTQLSFSSARKPSLERHKGF